MSQIILLVHGLLELKKYLLISFILYDIVLVILHFGGYLHCFSEFATRSAEIFVTRPLQKTDIAVDVVQERTAIMVTNPQRYL